MRRQVAWARRIGLERKLAVTLLVTAIASGLAQLPYPLFLGVSILVRGLRFGLEAWLLKIYGEPIRAFVEKRLALTASAAAVVIVGAVMALKFAL